MALVIGEDSWGGAHSQQGSNENTRNNGNIIGIITIEDVIEEIINHDIYDESDLGIC